MHWHPLHKPFVAYELPLLHVVWEGRQNFLYTYSLSLRGQPMLKDTGKEELTLFTERSYQESISKITPSVWHVLGVGHSNAIIIEGKTGVLLIDTLDTLERGQRLANIVQEKTGKSVHTILYTHGHPDHRGGAGAFAHANPEIIAFAPLSPALKLTEQLKDVLERRGARQFGYALSDAENISQGIGIREGIAHGEKRAFCPPTTVYTEDRVSRSIDGIQLEMVRLPGEAEDQIAVWLPEQKILCCGDTFFGCWPNLYAIRGGQYRDIALWTDSLHTLLSYPAEHLLPGHTRPISGAQHIQTVLGNFRDAILYVLNTTLAGLNAGKSEDQLAAEITLPEKYASLPYLGEFYGCVDWSVRAICTAYVGWFDGNPTRLHPLAPKEHAHKTLSLMGGALAVRAAAEEAQRNGEYQWCLELCDLLLDAGQEIVAARQQKAQALVKIADLETSANGRHYYLACAHEYAS